VPAERYECPSIFQPLVVIKANQFKKSRSESGYGFGYELATIQELYPHRFSHILTTNLIDIYSQLYKISNLQVEEKKFHHKANFKMLLKNS